MIIRFAIIALALLMATPALANKTKITPGVANIYYKNCMSADDPRMSDEAQESLCSCASVKIMDAMYVEEIFNMKKKQGPGRDHFNKMLIEVYGPCMKDPVQETLKNQCMNDEKIKAFNMRSTEALCQCTATRSVQMLDTIEGMQFIERLLNNDPLMNDPFDPILADPVFRDKAYEFLYRCLRG